MHKSKHHGNPSFDPIMSRSYLSFHSWLRCGSLLPSAACPMLPQHGRAAAVTAISAAVFFVGDPNETYREWSVESQSLARWSRCADRSFWWHRPDCSCGPAALRQSGGVPQLPIAAPILSRSACCDVAARCSLGCQLLDPVGRPKTCRARARGSRLIDNIFHLRNSA
jgi:hypothetical protein